MPWQRKDQELELTQSILERQINPEISNANSDRKQEKRIFFVEQIIKGSVELVWFLFSINVSRFLKLRAGFYLIYCDSSLASNYRRD
jgi:hypothetical protein